MTIQIAITILYENSEQSLINLVQPEVDKDLQISK